ncbi:retrovirus-related pol polyprotein from transposon TNT 1-94 [Tanacetum coccineum]
MSNMYEDPIYDEVGTSYDSSIPSEVQDQDNYSDNVDEYYQEHEMQSDVQHNYVVNSDADYTSDSNIILYDQYMEDNEEHGVQSMSANKQVKVVNDTLTSELARYKELAGEYEKRAKFELTEREQKIDEQMRIIISDRNRKETSLKSELHTVQMQLRSILDQYKSKTEEVTILKKDFKQTEDKHLEEFLDMKKLKDKVEDRLYKQDQSVQTVHMLCRPNPFYDEKKKVAIGYKNPLCLTHAKQVQSALYNGTEIVMTNHKPAVVHDSEETLEIAELTRKRMYEKMKSPLCIQNKIKFAPSYYSKENYLAIFAPQRDLTPKQIFWAKDENDRKKVEASVLKPLSTPTVYPPNTHVKLVPRRITPTGVTEGERGVQKALFKEVKEIEEIFDQMSTEVDPNTVDKQCAEIERKNLLTANENLIANCLSNQLLFAVEHLRCLDLEAEISKLQNKNQKDVNDDDKRSCETYNAKDVTALIEQNERVRAEIEKVKQHYKELYDSIKITRAHTSEKTSTMLNEIESLKAQLKSKVSCVTSDSVKPKVLAPDMYAIDVKPIPPPLKNNRSAHLNYINHLKESVETVREIVEEARVVKPLDNALNYACQYTKLSQELLEYVIGTCPKSFNEKDNKAPSTPLTRKKQVTFNDKPRTSSSNTQKHEEHQKVQHSNIPVIPSTGVNSSTEASGSKPRSNTKNNRNLPAKSVNQKTIEDHPMKNKSVWTKVNRVDSSISSKRVVINSNSESVCKMCNKCLMSVNHDMCVLKSLNSVNATPTVKIILNKGKQIWKPKGKLSDNSLKKAKRVWKATGKLFANVGYQWRPTGKKFSLGKLNCGYQWRPTGKKFALGEQCPLTKLPVKCRTGRPLVSGLRLFKTYDGESFKAQELRRKCDLQSILCGRTWTQSVLCSRSTNLYTILINDMMKSSLVCLLSKASKIKSWLWHRRLNHLNFCTINDLARKDLVRGLPRLKFEKDHLCSACQLGKSKSYSHKPKTKNTNMEVLHNLHMDLCGPMRVQSINEKKYILVIVDDYSRFIWVKFLRSNDETLEFVINFLKQIQVGLNKTVRYIRTDNGTEFVNQAAAVATALFGALCYPINDSEDLGLIPNQIYATNYVLPTDKDLELLFQPMFDEYFEVTRVNQPIPSATTVNAQVVPPVIYHDVAIGPTIEDTPITQATLHPSVNLVTGEPGSTQSSSGDVSIAEPNQANQPPAHL